MMKYSIKIALITAGAALCLLQTTSLIRAEAAGFSAIKFKIASLLAPAPPPAAPANDDCANAINLVVNPACSFTSGTVADATQSIAPDTCNGFGSPAAFDVWYKFTAGANGQIITVKGSASFDAVVVLLDGCGGTTVDCSDNTTAGGTEMINTSGLTPGHVYYIRIYHYGSVLPSTLTFDICVSLPAPPPVNDDCTNAINLTVDSLCTSVSGTVAGATQSAIPDTCNGFASSTAFDVWYKFTATAVNNVIKVQGALSFDAVVTLRDSCSGHVIDCSDNTTSGGIETIRDTNLIIGHTYYIRVYSYGSAIPSTPDFDICVSLPPPPEPNDNCSTAILLAVDSLCNYTHGSVDGATQSLPPDSCSSFTSATAYDVWYKFVAAAGGQNITVKGSDSFDAVVTLRDSCGGFPIDCSDHSASGGTEVIYTAGLTAGHTYYVRVYSYGSSIPSTPEFDICISRPPPPPANDNCFHAITLTTDSVCNFTSGTVLGATQSAPPDSCGFSPSASARDVWYKFVAADTISIITVQGSLSFDAIVVLKDSCNGAPLNCADNTGSGGIETIYASGLHIGNTYYIRVYAYGSVQPATSDFTICVAFPPPPAPNDNCAHAITLTAHATCTPIAGTVAGSTQSIPADTCNGFHSSAAFDVWYKFIATAATQSITVKGGASFDAIILLSNTCNGPSIDCADNTTTGGTEQIDASGLVIGNTYYIRVYSYGSSLPSTPGFEICLLDSGPAGITSVQDNITIVNVYPNPAENKVTIGLKSAGGNVNVIYKILNVNGQTALEGQFASNSLQKDVDISSLTSGIYNIQIKIGDNLINKKIVVMNK